MVRLVVMTLCTALHCSLALCADEGQFVVVVSAKSDINKLSAEDIGKLFTGKLDNYPDGETAIPVNLPENSEIRTQFALKVLNKTPAQMHAYWSKLLFTGRGKPPMEVTSPGEMKTALTKNPGAIGYLDRSALDNTVKIVCGF